VGATRPCLPIVRAVFAALADPAGVTAHRPGALEREQAEPSGAVQAARHDLAGQLAGDLCRIDAQRRATKAKVAAAIRASGTTVTEVSGAGPVIAATVIGDVRDISRFARITSLLTTAPRQWRCRPATARFTGCRRAATGA